MVLAGDWHKGAEVEGTTDGKSRRRKNRLPVERYPKAAASVVRKNLNPVAPPRHLPLSPDAVRQRKKLMLNSRRSRSRVVIVEPPGSVPNKAVDLTVRTVTVRACARPVPARPAGHGRR